VSTRSPCGCLSFSTIRLLSGKIGCLGGIISFVLRHSKKEKSFVKKLKKILDKKGVIPFIIMVAWLVAVSVKIKGKVLPSSLLFLDL